MPKYCKFFIEFSKYFENFSGARAGYPGPHTRRPPYEPSPKGPRSPDKFLQVLMNNNFISNLQGKHLDINFSERGLTYFIDLNSPTVEIIRILIQILQMKVCHNFYHFSIFFLDIETGI